MTDDSNLGDFLVRWYDVSRHDLAASDSETTALSDLLEMAGPEDAARWDGLRLGYPDLRGSPWLRQSIAETYRDASADQVLCFAGAQEALACILRALHAPGDHAIMVVPAYQPSGAAVQALYDVTEVALDPAAGWALDVAAIEHAVRPTTRLVLVNFPNNPTGKVIPPDDFTDLVTVCRRHGLWLIADEVYRLIDHAGPPRLPPVVDAYERGISIDALSKAYGLPGLRVGWAAARDPAVLDRAAAVKHGFSSCLATPSEVLANIALSARARILGRNRWIAASNLRALRSFMERHPGLFTWTEPDGGVVGYIRYHGVEGVDEFATRLARDAGVLVLPASVWHAPMIGDRFRIGFGHRSFDAGLAALEAWVTAATLAPAGA
jgi:aspartate/methionine/tyrosine aminotransferase